MPFSEPNVKFLCFENSCDEEPTLPLHSFIILLFYVVKMGLAEKIGAGRSTRYRFKGRGESLSNRKLDPANRKPRGKGEDR